MSFWERIKRWWISPPPKDIYPKPKPKEFDKFNECYYCGCTSYYEGASGGASMNITCADCGARFNIYILPDGIHFGEELEPPNDHFR